MSARRPNEPRTVAPETEEDRTDYISDEQFSRVLDRARRQYAGTGFQVIDAERLLDSLLADGRVA